MSERYDREEEPGRRGEERRRVGEVREERGLKPDRGTSWTSVIFG